MLPNTAELTLAPCLPPSCGINAIANPPLNDEPGAIITFPGTSRAGEPGRATPPKRIVG